ncbi:hypothetical protein SLA2020_426710 [Shorea laevis]
MPPLPLRKSRRGSVSPAMSKPGGEFALHQLRQHLKLGPSSPAGSPSPSATLPRSRPLPWSRAQEADHGGPDRIRRWQRVLPQSRRVWKRGYLLYGPPGSGKSSLIAAMAEMGARAEEGRKEICRDGSTGRGGRRG